MIDFREALSQLEEIKVAHEYQIRLRDMNHTMNVKETNEQHLRQLESLNEMNMNLNKEREKAKQEHGHALKKLDEIKNDELNKIENKRHMKLMEEYEKYQSIQAETSAKQSEWKSKIDHKQKEISKQLNELIRQFDEHLGLKNKETKAVCFYLRD